MNAHIIYMKFENGEYVIDRCPKRSLKQDLLDRFSEDACMRDLINNIFDYQDYAEQYPEELAERLLSKNMKNITPR